jgi:hypothetical protein
MPADPASGAPPDLSAPRRDVFQAQVRGFDVSWIGSATPP